MNIQLASFLHRAKKLFARARPASWPVAAAGALLLGACVVYDEPPRRAVVVGPPVVVADAEVEVDSAPPAPVQEVVTASPGVEFVWIPGVWLWQGRWVWGPGHWARPPRPGAIWVPDHYEYRGGRHLFIRGGWR